MWEFIKKIFSESDGGMTVVMLDEDNPDASSTYNLKSFDVIKIVIVVAVISIALTIGILFITPLSSIYKHQVNESFRDQVIAINQRVRALQDSLEAREIQLNDLKKFLRTVPDTSFPVRNNFVTDESTVNESDPRTPVRVPAFSMLNQNQIISSSRLSGSPEFPSTFPIKGTLTQEFSAANAHYGIDLSAETDTEFRSIADGTVINTGWTINYGYVIYVQHAGGIMSVYKHGARLLKEQGDVVLKGDLLGQIGNSGVISSGSHLHLEIWKDGIPQNPLMYLIE